MARIRDRKRKSNYKEKGGREAIGDLVWTDGVRIGRPRLGIELRRQIAERAARGETPYAIAKTLGIDRHTAAKYAS